MYPSCHTASVLFLQDGELIEALRPILRGDGKRLKALDEAASFKEGSTAQRTALKVPTLREGRSLWCVPRHSPSCISHPGDLALAYGGAEGARG